MTDRKKTGVAFWTTLGLVILLAYPASFGPAVWLVAHDWLPSKRTSIVFRPLLIEARREIYLSGTPAGRRPLLWWASIWDPPRPAFLRRRGLGSLLVEMDRQDRGNF